MPSDLLIGMAGSGGDGVVSAGESLITAAALEGYHAMMTKSFGPQIRGGESSFRLRLSTKVVLTPNGMLDIAFALNWDDFLKFGSELPIGGRTSVIYEAKTGVAPDKLPLPGVIPAEAIAVPLEEMAKAATGSDKGKNSVVLGLIAGWVEVAVESMRAGIRKRFTKKGEAVLEGNLRAFDSGLTFAREHPLKVSRVMTKMPDGKPQLVTDGNDMAAAAAIFSGCDFFGGYPITPSTEIMQFLTREIWKYGGAVLQAEDEIAGVGAAVGASFAGKKAMTATSGPGMSLKTEMLGLASIAELPLVAINVQRGGPSTGIPTKSEQSDVLQAAFSAHGDCVRPVLAPINVADVFGITVEAFNIAEQYQTPVIVLSDQEIGQRKETVTPIDTSRFTVVNRLRPSAQELDNEPYERFRLTESGISPITHPGMKGGNHLNSGIEHNEHGSPTASGAMHAKMVEKRMRKFNPLRSRRDLFVVEGRPNARLAIVSWGSMAGVAIEALHAACDEGLDVKLLIPKLLFPVPEEVYQEFFKTVRAGVVVEQNYMGQVYRLIRMYVDVPKGLALFGRSGSNPILANEIVDRLREQSLQLQRALEPELEPLLG